MKRIEKLRLAALEHFPRNDEFLYNFYKMYYADTNDSEYERYANAYFFALSNFPPHIGEDELVVGECELQMNENDYQEWQNVYLDIARKRSEKTGGTIK